ncbi:hypothetical protein [Spirosoma telluris]|uniref:hypothetical protein n=1 Tax=Spirosoma telluris TaxID=2183553 RepID=UPI002FC28634
MPNSDFTVEDFCKDPNFIHWVLSPTDESNRFWQSFMADFPHKVADIQLAIDYVRTIRFREIEPSEQDLARLKQRIWNDIEQPAGNRIAERRSDLNQPVRIVQWYQRPYWAAAAVIVLVMSIGLGWGLSGKFLPDLSDGLRQNSGD